MNSIVDHLALATEKPRCAGGLRWYGLMSGTGSYRLDDPLHATLADKCIVIR